MSEVSIVNRTPLGAGLTRDLAEIEAEKKDALATVTTETVQSANARVTGRIDMELASKFKHPLPKEFSVLPRPIGKPELEEADPVANVPQGDIQAILPEPPDTPYSPSAALISESLKTIQALRSGAEGLEFDEDAIAKIKAGLVRSTELKIFRDQVVSAFKHLGLDTKKFFGV